MGKLTPAGQDLANVVEEQVLTAVNDVSDWFRAEGTFNFSVWGAGVGSVVIERSFDGGTTAIPLTNLGQAVVFTGPASESIFGRESGVLWRARRAVATSGSVNVRFSQ